MYAIFLKIPIFSGSLDRNHLRRSRGRPRRSDLFHEDRDRSAPVVPEKAVVEKANTKPPVPPTSGPEVPDKNMKNRVESWLQESEEDAKKAEMYLDKKRERKAGDKENPDTTKIGTIKKNAMSLFMIFFISDCNSISRIFFFQFQKLTCSKLWRQ